MIGAVHVQLVKDVIVINIIHETILIFNTKLIYRGYSNVFVKYVFYFTSEVDSIYIS